MVLSVFSTTWDASGRVTVTFTASVNYAMISGIEITPVAGDVMPWVYTELWSSTSPLKATVASLKAAGAVAVGQQYMNSLCNQGFANSEPATNMPI